MMLKPGQIMILKFQISTEIKNQFSEAFNYPNGIYIAKITLGNDIVVTKKLVH